MKHPSLKASRGFTAVEALLILLILGIAGLIGYYVWHGNRTADKNLADTSAAAPDDTANLSLVGNRLPTGWQAALPTNILTSKAKQDVIILTRGSSGCVVFVAGHINDPTASISGASAYRAGLAAKMGRTNTNGYTTTKVSSGTVTVSTAAGQQTVPAITYVTKDATGKTPLYQRVAYLVQNGYYVSISQSCKAAGQLGSANTALRAIQITL